MDGLKNFLYGIIDCRVGPRVEAESESDTREVSAAKVIWHIVNVALGALGGCTLGFSLAGMVPAVLLTLPFVAFFPYIGGGVIGAALLSWFIKGFACKANVAKWGA
ncbi:MAG: hypothetical protein LBS68_01370 [Puniceicoccales bacterium]|jgi:hypothetical protein|nr:hypothetical protein [Puniceicoccales bacterium]